MTGIKNWMGDDLIRNISSNAWSFGGLQVAPRPRQESRSGMVWGGKGVI